MLKKIKALVKKETDESNWKYHIVPVVKYAKKLARLLKVNEEIVELAALLHDIGKVRHGGKGHEKTGIPEAEKILKGLKCPEPAIEEVKHCIESHRGIDIPPKTKVAEIIANADAMAHFDILPVFFYWRLKKTEFEDAFRWIYDKIEREWNKKLTLPEAKKMVEEKYHAIKLVLDSTKEYV